jgi:hypothetical protein
MWPAFVVLTLVDGVLLHELPPTRTGVDLIPGILIATFANLVLIGAVAPWLAKRIWVRRPQPASGAPPQAERELLTDRVGTALLVAGVFGVLAAGLAARPAVVSETEDTEEAARALLTYVRHSGNEELNRNLETANTARLADGYFRTCIARDERGRFFCFFIDVNKKPTQIIRDPSAAPNPLEP